MMKNYFKFVLIACFVFTTSIVNAQFKFGDKSSVGQTISVDTMSGVTTFLLDFNTDKGNSTWMQDTSGITVSFSKCQTNKGFRSEVFESDATDASTVYNGDFKTRRWNSYENPVRMASIDSMTAIFAKYGEKNAGTEDSVKNVIWKPSACLFDLNDTNQVFGTHPGMYKRVEYGFHFKFESTLTSDIEFEMDTYDAGNTGQTASYELILAVGSEENIVGQVADFYVSGSGKKSVKLAEAAGVDFSTFSNEKVYFWLKTTGTGTEMAKDSFDPTVVFDNMTVSYQMPVWISPPAGAIDGTVLDNMDNPLIAPVDMPTMDSLLLKIDKRTSKLEIVDDLGDRKYQEVLNLMFLDTLGLMANDGNGNYNVEVPYTYEAPVWNSSKMEWSKAKITVAAPESMTNDDMMFYFYAVPTSGNLHAARLEMDCGTRIWYDYFMQGTPPVLDSLTPSVGTLSPAYSPETTDYQLNLPSGTPSVEFTASSSGSGVITLPPPLALTDGEDYEAEIVISNQNGSLSETYTVHIHVQTGNEVLYLSANGDGVLETSKKFDKKPVQMLKDAGYSVTFEDKSAIKAGDFDYSPYVAIVISPGNTSSNIVQFAKDNYPLPVVCMQPDAARSDKWGWTGSKKNDGKEMFVSKNYTPETAQMEVTFNGHPITEDYTDGQLIKWTLGTADSADWSGREVKAYALNDSIPEAIELGRISTDDMNTMGSWWAIPEGTSVHSVMADGEFGRTNLTHRAVLMNVFSDGVLYASDDFAPMLVKSLSWVLQYESDATLASLVPSEGTLSPVFDFNDTEYELNLPMGTSSVSLTATATSPTATVVVPDELTLTDGMDAIMTVVVTSADESQTTSYNVSVHVQSEKEVLYLSANGDGALGGAKNFDKIPMQMLRDAGYSVTFEDKSAIKYGDFDYTPYVAMVIAPGNSSSNIVQFAKDNYPLPVVCMQPDAARSDKWGWTGSKKNDGKEMFVSKNYTPETAKMQVTYNEHYITSDYTDGQLIQWTNGTADSVDWSGREVKAYALNDSISEAIQLGLIPTDDANLMGSWWAVPEGSSVRSVMADGEFARTNLTHRVVLMNVFSDGVLYASDDFGPMMIKSLEWVLQYEADASLASLVPSVGELSPAFDYKDTEYELNLPMGTKAVSLTATANSPKATVVVPDELALTDGMDAIMKVVVTSADESQTTSYNVAVHVQNDKEIMYLSANGDGALGGAKDFDKIPMQMLRDAGYSVTFEDKSAIKAGGFDYSPYAAMVIAPGNSSSNIVQFAKDGYPLPVVCMQPDAARSDKWGWTGSKKNDGKEMFVSKNYTPETAEMEVLNNEHPITSDYSLGQMIRWTIGTADSADWSGREVKAYALNDSIPEAIELGRIPTDDGNSMGSWWAVPEGTSVRSVMADGEFARTGLANRAVLMNVFSDGVLYASDDFKPMLVKSLDWVLGSITSVPELSGMDNNVVVYPNPTRDAANVRFSIDRMQEVSLSLYNMVGQKIEITTPQVYTGGTHEINFRVDDLNDGMYIYILELDNKVHKGKLNVLK